MSSSSISTRAAKIIAENNIDDGTNILRLRGAPERIDDNIDVAKACGSSIVSTRARAKVLLKEFEGTDESSWWRSGE